MIKVNNNLIFNILLLLLSLWSKTLLVSSDVSVDEPTDDLTEDKTESILYSTPNIDNYYIYEHFDEEIQFGNRWMRSESNKADSEELKYDGEFGLTQTQQSIKGDSCLIVKSRAKHHAISSKLDKVFKFDGKPLILQYEVQFRNGQECGGAYLKLLSSPSGNLKQMNDKTKYSIMFGPDKCGNDMKLHFIFQHKNPKNGTLSEKHWKKVGSVPKLDEVFKDNRWHQLRLEINPDNTYEVTLNKNSVGKGSLLEDFNPSVNPPKEIDDSFDSKPEDWDEREKIPDPEAVKPDDWDENEPRKVADPSAKKPVDWDEDEPEMIPDPEAKQPLDWDNEMDGEWEAPLITNTKCSEISGCGKWSQPLIDNPKYKGKWRASLINNPAFKGKWSPRKIPNPDFYEDLNPYKTLTPIDAVAFELWTISDGIAFDNILITDDIDVAKHISSLTYQIKKEMSDSETDNIVVKAIKYTNKYPWLWAVYILAIGLPVVLFIAFCCVSPVKRVDTTQITNAAKSESTSDSETVGVTKKTDQSSPDDLIEEEEEKESNELEVDQEELVDEEEEEKTEEEYEEEEEEVVPPVRSSPRLRKTRSRKE